ncbi:MAG: methyltransferase domain-containing protein [Zetaproteobacteria bacterium]|nr:methyltransferase domain-containing protein [Zetaproteobacteria bacterium]
MKPLCEAQPEGLGLKDDIFQREKYPVPFEFNHQVAEVFDDMALRSIPQYVDSMRFISGLACNFLRAGSTFIDLGCSTGSLLQMIASSVQVRLCLIGMDCSPSMYAIAKKKLSKYQDNIDIRLHCADILQTSLPTAAFVNASYVLQFLPVGSRIEVFTKVYQSLEPGGVFVFSEKVLSPCSLLQDTATFFYEAFKRQHGYSQSEIERKKEALDNVLVSSSTAEYQQMALQAGFVNFEVALKWGPFATFVMRKKGI